MSGVLQDNVASVSNLHVHFPIRGAFLFGKSPGVVKAVDGVSFDIRRGETLGLVGESGCGKTTVGRAILQLNRITSGTVEFNGADLANSSPEEMRALRRRIQLIFQDPYASLNPRMSIGRAIAEPIPASPAPFWRDRHQRSRSRTPLSRRPIAQPHDTLSTRILGRTEAAHRHRPGACLRAGADRVR